MQNLLLSIAQEIIHWPRDFIFLMDIFRDFILGVCGNGIRERVTTPNGIRTHVGSVKGCCPGPLDDGGAISVYQMNPWRHKYQIEASFSLCVLKYNQ
jgi:hypothetical protein